MTFHNQGASIVGTNLTDIYASKVKNIGFYGGVPLGMVERSSKRTVVLSPMSNFLATTVNVVDGGTVLASGVQGASANVPAGHVVEAWLHAESTYDKVGAARRGGISSAFLSWGDTLLRRYGKTRTAADATSRSKDWVLYRGPLLLRPAARV